LFRYIIKEIRFLTANYKTSNSIKQKGNGTWRIGTAKSTQTAMISLNNSRVNGSPLILKLQTR